MTALTPDPRIVTLLRYYAHALGGDDDELRSEMAAALEGRVQERIAAEWRRWHDAFCERGKFCSAHKPYVPGDDRAAAHRPERGV